MGVAQHTTSASPLFHLGSSATHFMAVDTEALGDLGFRKSFLHVADAGGEAAALVGGEGDDSLAVMAVMDFSGKVSNLLVKINNARLFATIPSLEHCFLH